MLLNLTLDALKDLFKQQGLAPYRADQIFDWIHKKAVLDPAKMSNLNEETRQFLLQYGMSSLQLVKRQDSGDGQTFKFLWQLSDGNFVESVLIEAPERLTLCVSSQVGCAARCAFCASGKQGLMRNLTPGEILEQFVQAQVFLAQTQRSLTHLVFMGMGEPLHNLDAVVQTIQTLTSKKGAQFSARRITVSTVGIVEEIDRLATYDLGVNLVLSLHAPTHDVRKRIIPIARQYPLEEVLGACDRYRASTGRDLTYEYTLLEGINDSTEQAHQLADLLADRPGNVNLIPYNPIDGLRLKRPTREAIEAFQQVLHSRGVPHTCRYTKGVDIAAACGQLALAPKLQTLIEQAASSEEDCLGEATANQEIDLHGAVRSAGASPVGSNAASSCCSSPSSSPVSTSVPSTPVPSTSCCNSGSSASSESGCCQSTSSASKFSSTLLQLGR